MIVLLQRHYQEDSYIVIESFKDAQEVKEKKNDIFTYSLLLEKGFRYFFVIPLTIQKTGDAFIRPTHNDGRGTHLVYLDDEMKLDFDSEEVNKAWSDYREHKIDNILNKNSI